MIWRCPACGRRHESADDVRRVWCVCWAAGYDHVPMVRGAALRHFHVHCGRCRRQFRVGTDQLADGELWICDGCAAIAPEIAEIETALL